jgi:hypothetical protein
MTRFASTAAIVLSLAFASFTVSAQSKASTAPAKAAATTTAPPAKAGFVVPIKGLASIQMLTPTSKRDKNDIVTSFRLKNMSNAPIALLKVDEYWYDKNGKTVTGDTFKVKQPIMPGQVIDIVLRSPYSKDVVQDQLAFSHANGKIDVKKVKKFD